MLSTTNSLVANFIAMIPMLTGIGGLLAFLVPTDCLRSLENRPSFHRALRQSVGNPEAVCSFYTNARQRPDGNYAWTGQPFFLPSSHMLTFFKKLFTKDPTVILELKLDDGRLYQERVRPEEYEERLEYLQQLFHQEKVLGELNFIYCLVGNIVEERLDRTQNKMVNGTIHFSPGTKVYCYPPQWGDGYEKIKVIGLHRKSHKLITIVMPSKHITNWRLKTVYHPLIIKEMKATGGWLNKESHKEDILTMLSSLTRPKP